MKLEFTADYCEGSKSKSNTIELEELPNLLRAFMSNKQLASVTITKKDMLKQLKSKG